MDIGWVFSLAGTGRFFIRRQQPKKAIAVAQLGLDYYPTSAGLYYGLANPFEADDQRFTGV